jgi:hypothetical protein
MPRENDALLHLNFAREAEKRGDFLGARVSYMKYVECWKQANQTGGYDGELQKAMQEYEGFVRRDPIFAKLISSLIPFIKANPGTLQSDISKQIPSADWASLYNYNRPVAKEDIYYALYFAEKQGKIRRTKKGRSYELCVAE